MDTLLLAKWHAIAFLFLGPLVVGMFPWWFLTRGWRPYPMLMSTLVCFGGGMLLSASLVHLLPEIRAEAADYGRYVEVLVCVAMFVLYFADEVGQYVTKAEPQRETEHQPLLYERQPPYNPYYTDDHCNRSLSQASIDSLDNLTTSWGLVTKLWVHGVLEGLAVGLEDTPSTVVLLFVAVFAHRLADAFSLGIDFAAMDDCTSLRHLWAMLLYVVGAPLGIAIGAGFPHMPALQCFAAGALLYLSLFDVLFGERACSHRRDERGFEGVAQCFGYVAGFTLVTALTFTVAN